MGVIYTPPARREPTRPVEHASDHRLGTVWQTPDGFRWVVEWDDQDKRPVWSLVECQGHATCKAALHEHGCFADLGRCDHPEEHGSGA